eukprot:403363776
MPNIKTSRTKKAPKGWDLIEPTLSELQLKLRDVENEPIEGKRKPEVLWPIYKLHHQMSRYIFDLYYKKKEISRELYEWCLRERWADAALIAKWKKGGFERLCCLQCIQKGDSAFGKGCICRVPKAQMEEEKVVECVKCGCKGCASGD